MQRVNYIINKNYKLLYLDYLININKFIIFINFEKLKEIQAIFNENIKYFIVNSFYIKKLFMLNFLYLSSYFIFIFMNNIDTFINMVKVLDEKKFGFSYKYCLSNFINRKTFINQLVNFNYIHFVIFKLVYNIIILLFLFLYSIVKFINFK